MSDEYYHQYIDIDGMPLDLSLNKTGEPKVLQLAMDDSKLFIPNDSEQEKLAHAFQEITERLGTIARLQGSEQHTFANGLGVDFTVNSATAEKTFEDARKYLVEMMQERCVGCYTHKPADIPDITPSQLVIGMDWDEKNHTPIAQIAFNADTTSDKTGGDFARWLQDELKTGSGIGTTTLPEQEQGWVILQHRSSSPEETYLALAEMHALAETIGFDRTQSTDGKRGYIPRPHFLEERLSRTDGGVLLDQGQEASNIPLPSEVTKTVENMPRRDGMDSFATVQPLTKMTFGRKLYNAISTAMQDGADLQGAVSIAVNKTYPELPGQVSAAVSKDTLAKAIAEGIQQRMSYRGEEPPSLLP